MRDMSQALEMWGAWAACDSNGVDWQPIAAGFKGLLPNEKRSRVQCNDDDGMFIDACIAKLKKYRIEEYELVIAHYVLNISLRSIARKRKCCDGTVRKDLQTAIGFIEGCMCMMK